MLHLHGRRELRSHTAIPLAAVALGLLAGSSACTRNRTGAAAGGRIVFSATLKNLGTQVVVTDAGGGGRKVLTTGDSSPSDPVPSPDGTRIAFLAIEGGARKILVMNADGSDPTPLTGTHDEEYRPAWSPGSDALAFESNHQIYVAQLSGVTAARVFKVSQPPVARDRSPSWSPDGRTLAYVSDRDGAGRPAAHDWHAVTKEDDNTEIYLVGADGSGTRRLTTHIATDRRPIWAPDGMHLAFISNRESFGDVYRIDTSGAQTVRLTTLEPLLRIDDRGFKAADFPVWSPDGTRLAFSAAKHVNNGVVVMVSQGDEGWTEPNEDLFLADADGTNPHPLTPGHSSRALSWSPNGQRIVFWTQGKVCTAKADGTAPSCFAYGSDPAWLADAPK